MSAWENCGAGRLTAKLFFEMVKKDRLEEKRTDRQTGYLDDVRRGKERERVREEPDRKEIDDKIIPRALGFVLCMNSTGPPNMM